jgi:DNA polymerase V
MSNRVMTTLEEMSPRVEIYSIDEAFCDLTGVRNCRDLTEFCKEIRATVLKRTHLTVGVGIAHTKTLAKLANHAAKKWQLQTGGVVDLSNIDRQGYRAGRGRLGSWQAHQQEAQRYGHQNGSGPLRAKHLDYP